MAKLIQYATKASYYDGPFGENGVPWLSSGMGYVIVTDSGHLIIIDGGHDKDAEEFISLLESYAHGIPVVDTWIITHPHKDHYGVLFEISKRSELSDRVKILNVVSRFPEEFTDEDGDTVHDAIAGMTSALASIGAGHFVPEEGDILDVDGIKIHFLYVPDDCSWLDGPNQLSLIFTLDSKMKRVIFTGDAYRRNLQYVFDRHKSRLKCDMVQMPHHGLCDTGHKGFYDAVDADTVLIPVSKAGYRCMNSGRYGDAAAANKAVEDRASDVYRAFEGTVELRI